MNDDESGDYLINVRDACGVRKSFNVRSFSLIIATATFDVTRC